LDFWEAVLSEQDGQWAVMRLTREALVDVQGKANGYVQEVDYGEGICLPMIAPPVQFDETSTKPAPGPRFGADTDDVLLASGFEWDDLLSLKRNYQLILSLDQRLLELLRVCPQFGRDGIGRPAG
jgi:crotonobetainyl-CoA:carnitine CoA-transferase CaiB-like acyl-CoA transferase